MTRGIGLAALTILSGAALAGTSGQQLTFTYSDLLGTYDGSNFTSEAQGISSGDVTRVTGAGGTAEFDENFVVNALGSDVFIDLVVTVDQNDPQHRAQGVGNLILTDVDGDTIVGDLYGVFLSQGFGDYFFDGFLSNVYITTDDGSFDGTSGAADLNLPGAAPYEGFFVELSFAQGTGFFNQAFQSEVLASGIIIPAPGSAALIALGGGLVVTRRRRTVAYSPGM